MTWQISFSGLSTPKTFLSATINLAFFQLNSTETEKSAIRNFSYNSKPVI